MADPKDKLTPPSETKPGRSAAVKPPVLEGKARAAEPAKPEIGPVKPEQPSKTEATSKPAQTAKPDLKPGVPPAGDAQRRESATGPIWLAGLAGGVLGLGGAYALAVLGYWPASLPPEPPADPRIAQVSSAVPELQTITNTVQSELSVLTNRVAALETAGPSNDGVVPDLAPLAANLAELGSRVDALASAPPQQSDVSAEYMQSLSALETEFDSLQQNAGSLADEISALAGRLATLEAEQQERDQGADNQMRLPLILSGFETAFAGGRSYASELSALRVALPDLSVPEVVSAGAENGLSRPDAVIEAFNAALPDILAARPLDGGAGWQGATADWFRGVIALRPTGDVAGSSPEAVIARVEAALTRRDFLAAQAEFAQLPAPMQAAAGPVAGELAAQAEANQFLATLRDAALAVGGPT